VGVWAEMIAIDRLNAECVVVGAEGLVDGSAPLPTHRDIRGIGPKGRTPGDVLDVARQAVRHRYCHATHEDIADAARRCGHVPAIIRVVKYSGYRVPADCEHYIAIRYRDLVSGAPSGVGNLLISDVDGHGARFRQATCCHSGVEPNSIAGRNCLV